MPTAIAMPRLGMTMTEGMVVSWPLPVGSRVNRGELVLIIESDKSEVEVEATGSGVLTHIYVEPEETVPCGTLLAVLVEEGEEGFDPADFQASWEREQAASAQASPGPTRPRPAPAAAPASPGGPTGRSRVAATPAARKLAKELGVALESLQGSGPGGRITREDVEAQAAPPSADRVAVGDGVHLDVPSQGEGEPLLLLPGFGTDVSAFSAQIPALGERFALRGVNPRGVAGSDAPAADRYDVATLAEDVAALIEEPAHVVGASLGSAVAIELALRHPAKLRSLSLLTPLVRVDSRLAAVSQLWCELAAGKSSETLARMLMPWFFGRATLEDDKRSAQILRGLTTTVSRVPAPSLERLRAGMLAWSGSRAEELGRIGVPTLVIVAGEDLLAPDGEAIARAIPGARLETLGEAGHAVGIDAAESVNSALLKHLESCGAGPS